MLSLLLLLSAVASLASAQQAQISSGAVLNVGPAPSISVTMAPAISITVAQSATQQFTATLVNDPAMAGVRWTLACTGTCGTLSSTSSASGVAVIYTAPATIPSPATVTITATSVTDSTKLATNTIVVISGTTNPPIIINPNSPQYPPKQTAAASNTFPLSSTTGPGYIVGIGTGMGATITGVSDPINGAYTSVGCQADFNGGAPGVHTAMFYLQNGKAGVTSLTVSETSPLSSMTIAFWDIGNASPTNFLVGTGQCGGSSTATGNPVGPNLSITQAGQIAVSYLSPFVNCSGVANPFIFNPTPRGDATAHIANPAVGTYAPAYTCAPGSYATTSAVFGSGTSTGIAVGISPTTASVISSTGTQSFTVTVVNDSANAGTTLTLTGAGCSGATCGTLSASSTPNSQANVTYTAPASVPSPATVTLTATSVSDGSKTATSAITVTSTPVIGVTVSPTNVSTTAGGNSIQFIATISNDPSNKGANWGMTNCGSQCGSLSVTTTASGGILTYTPPTTVTSTNTTTLTANSIADPTKFAQATIIVSPTSGAFSCSGTTCPAFAGLTTDDTAQSAGAVTAGGRGGVVYNITSLADTTNSQCVPFNADTVTCTLRDVIQKTGARYAIWRVAGPITNTSRLQIGNPFISLLGQSTPGGPITLHSASSAVCNGGTGGDCTTLFIATHDVVARFLTYDGFTTLGQTGPDIGTVGFEFASGHVFNVIIDHCTARWWGNKVDVVTSNETPGTDTMTVQYCLFYEPNVNHPVIIQLDTTSGTATQAVNIDYHHNVSANYQHRWPLTNIRSGRWVDNIAWNPGQDSDDHIGLFFGAMQTDLISNVVLYGPQTVTHVHPYLFNQFKPGTDASNDCLPPTASNPSGTDANHTCTNGGPPAAYMVNNLGPSCSASTSNSCSLTLRNTPTTVVNDASQTSQTFQGWEGGEQAFGSCPSATCVIAPVPSSWFRSTPLPAQQFPIIPTNSAQLLATLLNVVGNYKRMGCDGNWVSNQDSQDARIIAEIKNGTGGTMFNGQFSSPSIAAGTKCTESLHDGIPDQWKTSHGLSTTDPNLYKTIGPNGLPYIESYYNGLQP